jgi:hypothetical protein
MGVGQQPVVNRPMSDSVDSDGAALREERLGAGGRLVGLERHERVALSMVTNR